MRNLYLFSLVALLISACSANVCSNYKAFSTSTTDSFCQDVACRQYCMNGSDVEKCMKFVYEDSFKLCQKAGSEPVPTSTTSSSTSSTPIPTTQSSPLTSDPHDCSTWSSDNPSYVQWCKNGCYSCTSLSGAEFEACLDRFKDYCTFGSETSPTTTTPIPTTQSPPSTSDPRDCSTWSSESPSYVEWCKSTGCSSCSSLTGSQFESCLDFYTAYCTFGNQASSTSTSTPPGSGSGPTVCKSWTGVVNVYDDYCQNTACPTCNGYADEATRQACYQSQVSHCSIPGINAPAPSENPPTTQIPTSTSTTSVSTSITSVSTSSSQSGNDGATFTKRVVYLDWTLGEGQNVLEDAIRTSVDNGFNVIVVGFWLHKHQGGKMDSYWDAGEKWMNLPSSKRDEILTYAHSKGAKITLTVGGATEHHPGLMNSGLSGSDYGKMCAEKVIESGLDGLDFDSEGWGPQDFSGKRGTQWLIDATKGAHQVLGSNKIISHAPQGPYFSTLWAGQGGYGEINRQVGDMIDYYYVQFYNQGASNPYNSYQTLFVSGQGSAIKEIIAQGVPQDKIVVGKYVTSRGGDGYTSPETLKDILCQGNRQDGFTAGGGIWMYDAMTAAQLDETKRFGKLLSSKC